MSLQLLSGKVQPETFEQFKELQDESGARTYSQFIEMLIEAYANPKTREIEVPRPTAEQAAEIEKLVNELADVRQQCENEKGRLMSAHTLEVEKLEGQIKDLTEQLAANPEPAPAPTPQPLAPTENQVLINLQPAIAFFIDEERAIAAKKSGEPWSREKLLLDTFAMGIMNGTSYPFKIRSAREINEVIKKFKSETNG